MLLFLEPHMVKGCFNTPVSHTHVDIYSHMQRAFYLVVDLVKQSKEEGVEVAQEEGKYAA